MYKKLFLGVCIIAMLFSCQACDDDDWAPYYSSTESVDVKIDIGNTLLEISDNIHDSLKQLESDFVLTEVVLTIDDLNKGSIQIDDILFTFVQMRSDGRNRTTRIDVSYSMIESTIYQTSFESGHGKRVSSAIMEPIGEKYMTMPIHEVIELVLADEDYQLLTNRDHVQIMVSFRFNSYQIQAWKSAQ
jgi:hypothetical protein